MAASSYARSYVVVYCLFAAVVLSLLLRLYTRARVLRLLGVDDYLATASVVVGAVVLGLSVSMTHHIRSVDDIDAANPTATLLVFQLHRMKPDLEMILRIGFASSILYLLQIGLVKISILFFYYRFMSGSKMRWILYAIGSFTVLFSVAMWLVNLFGCQPISLNWEVIRPHECAVDPFDLQIAPSVSNLVTDVLILVTPIPMMLTLNASPRKKAGLALVFLLGTIGTVATIVRLTKVARDVHLPSISASDATEIVAAYHFWSNVEITLVTICANLPALAALFNVSRRRKRPRLTGSDLNARRDTDGYPLGSDLPPTGKQFSADGAGPPLGYREERIMPIQSTPETVDVELARDPTLR